MIHRVGDDAWISRDVKCNISLNGDFIQIVYREMGLRKLISIPRKSLKQVDDLKNHGDKFETFCEISEPACEHTFSEESRARREYFNRQIH